MSLKFREIIHFHFLGSYGESGIDVFQREAEKKNICIAISEKVPSNADDNKFKEVRERLQCCQMLRQIHCANILKKICEINLF